MLQTLTYGARNSGMVLRRAPSSHTPHEAPVELLFGRVDGPVGVPTELVTGNHIDDPV